MEELAVVIREIAEKVISEHKDLFVVDVKVKGNRGNQKVLVFIDGDQGITIDDCSRTSRAIGGILEEEDLVQGKYLLEVSSPGLDHPITLKRQYLKNKGRQLEVEDKQGQKVVGELLDVGENTISIEMDGDTKEIDFKEIVQSKILVSFK